MRKEEDQESAALGLQKNDEVRFPAGKRTPSKGNVAVTKHEPGHRVDDSGTPTPDGVIHIPTLADEHVFLIGRPPVGEFLGYVRSQTVGGADADIARLMSEWRDANDHIRSVEERESGLADSAPMLAIPSEVRTMAETVVADPMFKRSFAFVPAQIRMVELDRLVVYQKHINLEFVRDLEERLGPTPSAGDVFNVCLPVGRTLPPTSLQQVAQNVYMFVSPSNDLRFVEAILLKPQNITGYAPVGPLVAVLGLVVGFSSNYLQAVHVEGRLVLHNGSHRAYALRELGITHVPCVVQTVSRREELEVVGSRELQEQPDRYLREKRPPLLKDYFDPRLRKIVRVPRLVRQVKLTFGLESIDTPAA